MAPPAAGNDVLAAASDPVRFRAAARTWLEAAVKAEKAAFQGRTASFYDRQQWWMAERNKVGLGTPHWPRAYGGADLCSRSRSTTYRRR
jgi:alkylation response protein AidB-like acyl-CoA dehydrogenase